MHRQYDFDIPVDRRGTCSVKWAPHAIAGMCGNPKATPFWVADMDVISPIEIQQAIQGAVQLGAFGYPDFQDCEDVFCAWAKQRHGWELDPATVTVCQGMLGSIALLAEMLTTEENSIIVPLPAYQPFVRMVNNLHRTIKPWELTYDEHTCSFSADLEEFEHLCEDPSTNLLIFCSPHNPTGIVWDKQTLQSIAKIAQRHDVTIISDEIHSDLAYGDTHIPFGKISSGIITCMAPSKTFNIAGEHFSLIIIQDPELRSAFRKRQEQLFLCEPSLLSGTAALAGYRYGYDWLMQLIEYLQGNLEYIDSFLKTRIPLMKMVKPHASFIGFIDCEGLLPLIEADAKNHPESYVNRSLSWFFGTQANIAVNDGTWFGGDDYRRFVRFNFGTDRAAIKQALKQVEQAVNALIART